MVRIGIIAMLVCGLLGQAGADLTEIAPDPLCLDARGNNTCVTSPCHFSRLLSLTRWYVEHYGVEPPAISSGNVLTVYKGGCEAFSFPSEMYACMAAEARKKEEAFKEYKAKREELLQVLAACEGP